MKGFIRALLVCVSISNFLGASSDLSSAHAHARLGRIAGQVSPAHVEQLQPAGVAATADFLKNPEYCSAIKGNWGQYLDKLGDTIIKEMLENEERYKDDYFVFYHAQMADNRLIVEFLRNLYEFRNKTVLRSDFEYLRFWYDGSGYADVNSYLDSFGVPNRFTAGYGNLNDDRRDIRAVLLAVNPGLFGHFHSKAECTFEYFLQNVSIGSYVKTLLKRLFAYYSFDDSYIARLVSINDLVEFKTLTGDIVQIFIPKKMVNDCAYLSLPWGVPRKDHVLGKNQEPLAINDYDIRRKRYVKCSGILDIIQNNTSLIESPQAIQFRLFFSKSGPLLDPHLGAKMFRFTTLTSAQLSDYKKQIRDVSRQIFAGYGGGSIKKRVRDLSKKYVGTAAKPYASSFIAESEQEAKPLTAEEEGEVKKLIDRLAQPKDIFQALAYRNPIEWIKRLIMQGADINAKNDRGRTVLMAVIDADREDVDKLDLIKYLIEPGGDVKGVDIEVQDRYGNTALMVAAAVGNLGIVRYLVEMGADAQVVNRQDGTTALMKAAYAGRISVIAYLSLLKLDREERVKALGIAAAMGQLGVVAYFLDNGIDVEAADRSGETALMSAASHGRLDVVRYLVEQREANIDAKDNSGKTALQLAQEGGDLGRPAVVDYLKKVHAKRDLLVVKSKL